MLIGVPVALTPGFGPQDDVLTVVPLLELVAADVDVPLAAAVLLELLLLLLPHPASTVNTPTATSAKLRRTRAEWPYILTLSSPR